MADDPTGHEGPSPPDSAADFSPDSAANSSPDSRPDSSLDSAPKAGRLRRSSAPEPKPKARLDAEFSELYRAHLRDVYSYAYYRVGNHHDAEDLTEQTFLQAYRHFERALRESRGRPLRPWLIRIAHNLAANLYRDRSRRPASSIEESAVPADPHTTEELVEDREELGRVLAGVRRLPDDRREALIMRFALGMDNREIARALGRSDGATKVLLHRAVKQLEGLVADVPEGGADRDVPEEGADRAASEGGADRDASEGGADR